MTPRAPLFALVFALSACHASHVDGPDMNPRLFAADATIRSLVGRLDAIGPAPTSDRCIFRQTNDGFVLAAELSPVVSPMPPIDARSLRVLRDFETVRVVSRWGIDGSVGPYVGTFTHHPPPARFAVVVGVEGDRAIVRSTVPDGPHGESLESGRVLSLLRSTQPSLVVLAPDSDVTTDSVARWLAALDTLDAPIALGMVLTTDRDLASGRPSQGGPETDRCDALPPVEDASPAGTLSPDSIRASLPALQASIQRCRGLVPTRAVALGGRIRLGLRIDGDGRARTVCATDDGVGDDAFRICVAEAARQARWPTPSPAGNVDVYLPLVIAPDVSAAHRGMCDASP